MELRPGASLKFSVRSLALNLRVENVRTSKLLWESKVTIPSQEVDAVLGSVGLSQGSKLDVYGYDTQKYRPINFRSESRNRRNRNLVAKVIAISADLQLAEPSALFQSAFKFLATGTVLPPKGKHVYGVVTQINQDHTVLVKLQHTITSLLPTTPSGPTQAFSQLTSTCETQDIASSPSIPTLSSPRSALCSIATDCDQDSAEDIMVRKDNHRKINDDNLTETGSVTNGPDTIYEHLDDLILVSESEILSDECSVSASEPTEYAPKRIRRTVMSRVEKIEKRIRFEMDHILGGNIAPQTCEGAKVAMILEVYRSTREYVLRRENELSLSARDDSKFKCHHELRKCLACGNSSCHMTADHFLSFACKPMIDTIHKIHIFLRRLKGSVTLSQASFVTMMSEKLSESKSASEKDLLDRSFTLEISLIRNYLAHFQHNPYNVFEEARLGNAENIEISSRAILNSKAKLVLLEQSKDIKLDNYRIASIGGECFIIPQNKTEMKPLEPETAEPWIVTNGGVTFLATSDRLPLAMQKLSGLKPTIKLSGSRCAPLFEFHINDRMIMNGTNLCELLLKLFSDPSLSPTKIFEYTRPLALAFERCSVNGRILVSSVSHDGNGPHVGDEILGVRNADDCGWIMEEDEFLRLSVSHDAFKIDAVCYRSNLHTSELAIALKSDPRVGYVLCGMQMAVADTLQLDPEGLHSKLEEVARAQNNVRLKISEAMQGDC